VDIAKIHDTPTGRVARLLCDLIKTTLEFNELVRAVEKLKTIERELPESDTPLVEYMVAAVQTIERRKLSLELRDALGQKFPERKGDIVEVFTSLTRDEGGRVEQVPLPTSGVSSQPSVGDEGGRVEQVPLPTSGPVSSQPSVASIATATPGTSSIRGGEAASQLGCEQQGGGGAQCRCVCEGADGTVHYCGG